MPPADNSRFLVEASKERHRQARERTEHAIATAARSKTKVTISSIAHHAKVSKSWIYTQRDLLAAIDHLRRQNPSSPMTSRTASTESLRRRLETSLLRNRALRQQVAALSGQLEIAHGELRRLRSFSGP
jgi:hypothetical protein